MAQRRFLMLTAVAAAIVTLSGCGGSEEPARFLLRPTVECLQNDDVPATTEHGDFVAGTASGGALRAPLGLNEVVVAFGSGRKEAADLKSAYLRFGTDRPGVEARVLRAKNVVLVWAGPPSKEELDRVTGCLKG